MRRAGRLGPIVLLFLFFVPCAGAWTWPVRGPVLETFSFDPAHPYAAGQHRGIAIGADAGTAVVAPAAGIVTFAGTVPTNGLTLTIQTADGLAVSLTHLGSIGDHNAVFAFHNYCALLIPSLPPGPGGDCALQEQFVLQNADAQAAASGDGLLMDEWGDDPNTKRLNRMTAEADAARFELARLLGLPHRAGQIQLPPSLPQVINKMLEF